METGEWNTRLKKQEWVGGKEEERYRLHVEKEVRRKKQAGRGVRKQRRGRTGRNVTC